MARAGVARTDAELLQAQSEWFPQLNGNLTYDRTLSSEFEVFQSSGLPGGTLSNLPFGRENIWRTGLSLSQNLYAGGHTTARIGQARASGRSASLGVASARANVVLDTAQAYFDVVLTEQLLAIAEATMEQARVTLEQVRAAYGEGARPEFDLLRAQVSLENQQPIVVQRRAELPIALLRLRQLLDLAPDQPLRLTTGLDEVETLDVAELGRTVAEVPEETTAPRVPVQQARELVRLRESTVDVARSQYFPSFGVGSQYEVVNYPSTVSPDFDDLRTNWTLGFVLRLPIFTGYAITGDVDFARADLLEARARLRQTEKLAVIDTGTTFAQLDAARAVLASTTGAVGLAERAYAIAEVRFKEGVSTQVELSDARLQVELSRANRARSARDVQVAKLRVALLPTLPLGSPATLGSTVGAAATSSQPEVLVLPMSSQATTPLSTNPAQTGTTAQRTF